MKTQVEMVKKIEAIITEQCGDSEMHLVTRCCATDDSVVLEVTCYDNGSKRYFEGSSCGGYGEMTVRVSVSELDKHEARDLFAEWDA